MEVKSAFTALAEGFGFRIWANTKPCRLQGFRVWVLRKQVLALLSSKP